MNVYRAQERMVRTPERGIPLFKVIKAGDKKYYLRIKKPNSNETEVISMENLIHLITSDENQ